MNLRRILGTATAAVFAAASTILANPATAQAAVDVYITPGTHTVNGRQWNTTCSEYSSTVTRCRTNIWATQVTLKNGRYISSTGWVFNNLTYKASPRAQWADNNLGKDAEWTNGGRRWTTECDSLTTGRNGCRSYIWGTAIQATKTSGGTTYKQVTGWQFNNMVRFTDDVYATYSGSGSQVVRLPKGATELYVDFTHQGAEEYSYFSVTGLDAGNGATDHPVSGMGTGRHRGAVGLLDDDTVALDIEADGAWTLTVKPLSAAPSLSASGMSGSGSDVLWYYGSARTFQVTHSGESNFIVDQYTADDWRLLVNEIGDYSGIRAFMAGPSIITIDADGQWSIG